jgi:fatty-acid desaturase
MLSDSLAVCLLLMCRVSNHRAHHLHTDTPLDPHSAYEGFYWSFMGWWSDVNVSSCWCGHSVDRHRQTVESLYLLSSRFGAHAIVSD